MLRNINSYRYIIIWLVVLRSALYQHTVELYKVQPK